MTEGEIAYIGYMTAKIPHHIKTSTKIPPLWLGLPEEEKLAWEAAAGAVCKANLITADVRTTGASTDHVPPTRNQ